MLNIGAKLIGGGIGEATKQITEGLGGLATDLRNAFTGEGNQLKAAELQVRVNEIINQVNVAEATSARFFVAGWRPFLGWILGLSILMREIIFPLMSTYTKIPVPTIDYGMTQTLIQLLLGGTLAVGRTVEKIKGASGKH
jgi:hypothetical protein